MYCYQCEQTAKGTGCNVMGVCGKEPATAALQDLLVHATKGISMFAHRAAELGARDPEVDRAILDFLFATVTNVDFDPERLRGHLVDAAKIRDVPRTLYENACAKAGKTPETLDGPAAWQPAADLAGLIRQGEELLAHQAADAAGQRRHRPPGIDPLRAEGGRRLRRPRPDSRLRRPGRLCHLPRRTRFPHPGESRVRRLARLGDEGRRVEPDGDGPAGRRQHQHLRPSRAHQRPRHAAPRQVHLRLRPRPEGPRRTAQADRRQGDQRLHARRDAPLPRLSRS